MENGGAEVPRPGLDCTGCSDKTTGKGRTGQGNTGSLGFCYPRKSSLNPQITCHTCGGKNLIQLHSTVAGSWELVISNCTPHKPYSIAYNELLYRYFNMFWPKM